jgi:hypothetical protein
MSSEIVAARSDADLSPTTTSRAGSGGPSTLERTGWDRSAAFLPRGQRETAVSSRTSLIVSGTAARAIVDFAAPFASQAVRLRRAGGTWRVDAQQDA